MKANSSTSLLRGVLASVLLSLGLTNVAQRVDPIMIGGTQAADEMMVASNCVASCHLIETPDQEVG